MGAADDGREAKAAGSGDVTPASAGSPVSDRILLAALLYPGLVVVALGLQVALSNGMIESSTALWRELHWTALEPWDLGLREPYCYRPLFRAVVLGVTGLLTDAATPPEALRDLSYGVFITITGLSLLAAAWSFDLLLGRLAFSGRERLVGTALLLLGFPVLFSHDIPVQVREDFLGWALIALALVAVADDRPLVAGLIAAVGATCRETCLLGVLPLALVSRRPRQEVALGYVLPFAALVLVRLAVEPKGAPIPFLTLLDNSTLPARTRPLEALLFAFATFGALWGAAALRLLDPTPPRHPLLAPRVVGLAAAAVVAAGWTLGMVRENRITYLLAPFVIPLALDLARTGRLARLRASRPAWLAGLVVLVACTAGIAWVRADLSRVVLARTGGVPPEESDATRWFALGELNPGVATKVLLEDDPGPPLPPGTPVQVQALRAAVDAALEDDAFVEAEWVTIQEAWTQVAADPAATGQARAWLAAGNAPRRGLGEALGEGLHFDEVAHRLQPEQWTLYYGSPLQGPVVAIHLALLAALLVATLRP